MSRSRSRFADAYEAQQRVEEAAAATQRAQAACDRRHAARLHHHEHAELIASRSVVPVFLLNITEEGVALRLLGSPTLCAGDHVSIRLRDGRHLYGSAVWIGKDCLGLKFDAALNNVGDIIHFENRGAAIYQGTCIPRNQFDNAKIATLDTMSNRNR